MIRRFSWAAVGSLLGPNQAMERTGFAGRSSPAVGPTSMVAIDDEDPLTPTGTPASSLLICVDCSTSIPFFELVDDIFTNDVSYSLLFDYFFYVLPHILMVLVPLTSIFVLSASSFLRNY